MSGSAKKFRVGQTAMIRLNPQDCMTVVDVVQKYGLYISGMSFSQAVILAFACMSQTFRKNGLVPERDGFEYEEMLSTFPSETRGRRAFQYQLEKNERLQGPNRVYPAADLGVKELTEAEAKTQFPLPDPFTHSNPQVRKIARELEEIEAKRKIDPLNFDQVLYDRLTTELGKLI